MHIPIYIYMYMYVDMRTIVENRLYRVCRFGRRVCRQHPYVDLFTDLRMQNRYK